jgi:hypothetical protein
MEERHYKTAMGYFNMNPSTSHADIEKLHGLQRGTFKTYMRYSRQYEIDLKEAAEKSAKRPREASKKQVNPAELSGKSDLSSVHWGQEFTTAAARAKFLQSDEFLLDALLQSATSALRKHRDSVERNVNGVLSLWKASEMAAEEYGVFHPATIHKCAKELDIDPSYLPTSVRGGIQTCANDPKFVAALRSKLNERDVAQQNALVGKELEDFIASFHQEFYSLNPFAQLQKISAVTIRKLKKLIKVKGQKIHYVSARRWEAMGDPRNYVSYWCAIFLAFRNVPLELRFNWDDTSIFVGAEMRNGGNRFCGLAWTTDEQIKLMQKLHRSLGAQLPGAFGPTCTPRMIMWGFLAAACGRCHLCVIKIYDRSISREDSLTHYQLPERVGDCDIHVMFIRGKQMGTGAVDEAEGGQDGEYNDGHADEAQVASVVFGDIVGPKIESLMKDYFFMQDEIKARGFQPGGAPPAPPAAAPVPEAVAVGSSSDESDSDSSSDSSRRHGAQIAAGMPDASSSQEVAPHLPAVVVFQHHPHMLSKCVDRMFYRCQFCNVEGSGVVYKCCTCQDCFFHPSCCIHDKDVDLSSEDSAILAYVRQMTRHVEGADRRAAIACDGACGQTKGLVGTPEKPGAIIKCLLPRKIDAVKGSAQCSPSQNPLDCMRSFLMCKADKCNWTYHNAKPSGTMVQFIEQVFKKVMRNASTSDQNTFILSLMHVEGTISKNFNRVTMQKGWEVSGLIDLSFHKVMSHWMGYVHIRAEDVNGLLGLLPAFLYEMATTYSLSDRSMSAMQRYFPADFKSYPTDRNSLNLPRQRAALMSWLVEFHAQQATAVINDGEVVTEDRPSNPQLDTKGKAVCPCSKGGFRGKHYDDTDEGWKKHRESDAHKKWRDRERASSGALNAPVALACDLEWMQQPETAGLKKLCTELNLNAAIGKKFIAFACKDADLPALRVFTFERMLSTFGLARGQVLLIREHLDSAMSVQFPPAVARNEAILSRTTPQSAVVHPLPQPYALVVPQTFALLPHVFNSIAPVIQPPPTTQALFPAVPATQPRAAGGRFGKKGRGGEQ